MKNTVLAAILAAGSYVGHFPAMSDLVTRGQFHGFNKRRFKRNRRKQLKGRR